MALPITLKQLRYLVAVADEKHFGRAAAACNISQPSLSAQIQTLEDTLGVKAFERTKRRVMPTPAGEALVARARRVLAEADAFIALARKSAPPLSGPFRLGAIPTLAPYLLPQVMPALRSAYPELRLYLREDLTDRLLDRLDQGSLDAVLVAMPCGRAGHCERALYDEPFLLATPPDHPLAGREPVEKSDLAGEHLLLLEDGHCLRDQALEVCSLAGGTDEDRFGASSLETLREMVAGRIGITLIPELFATSHRADGAVAQMRFADPPPSRRIGLAWRKSSARDDDIRILGDFLADNLPGGVRPIAVPA